MRPSDLRIELRLSREIIHDGYDRHGWAVHSPGTLGVSLRINSSFIKMTPEQTSEILEILGVPEIQESIASKKPGKPSKRKKR